MNDDNPAASVQSAVQPLPAQFIQPGGAQVTLADYMASVIDAIVNHPRSLQKAIGPSEVGDPCARRIGHKLLGTPQRNQKANWKATVGTAVHSWLEGVFDGYNTTHDADMGGEERFLIETKLLIAVLPELTPLMGTPILAGSCDLYDRVTGVVVDHKTCGPTQLKDYAKNGPSDVYRKQAHLYGRGWAMRGHHVTDVAIVFLPRNGELAGAVHWSEPYDPAIADAALTRLKGIATACNVMGADAPALLPTAASYCNFCPFFTPTGTDLATGCPGHNGAGAERAEKQLSGLL